MRELLKEYISAILNEADRGGIIAQHIIIARLKERFPKYEFVSNKKGEQTADVTIFLNGAKEGAIESKSIEGGAGLTALFDNTVSLGGTTIFDGIAKALSEANGFKISKKGSTLNQFLSNIGGSAGQARPIPEDLEDNLNNPSYMGFSHKPVGKGEGKELTFKAEPGDVSRSKSNELVIFRKSKTGDVKAFMTVQKVGNKLVTSSSARPWASSGTIPVKGGISDDNSVKEAALKLMIEHFKHGEDDYFILVDGQTIYPFIVPGGNDPLGLKNIGAPTLSIASFEKAGLSTYGNAGAGKIRLALKASFNRSFSISERKKKL